MRKLVVLALCAGLSGCLWAKKSDRGTNYDPPADRVGPYDHKQL